MKQPFTLFLWACFFSVDVFLYLGGFFVAYTLCNPGTIKKLNIKSPHNILLTLFYRVFRIWPAYIIAVLFYWFISVYIGSGPAYSFYEEGWSECYDLWYKK